MIPNDDYTLLIAFDNGEIKRHEMINELYGIFKVLKDIRKFKQVFIDDVGNLFSFDSFYVDRE